jgi:uncharacterized membrane protein (UPF0127 family)
MIKHYLNVDIADTPSMHARGLMYRKKLGEDDGMLFKFRNPQNLKFWGVNTYIPLAIAFVSPEKEIVKISYISPCSTKCVDSTVDCDMAIEANYDFFKKNNINIGSKIEVINEDYSTLVKFLDKEKVV